MSEHTPLTEAERERVTWVLGDLLRYYAERRSMANPKGWDHVLRQFETAATDHYGLTEVQANEVRSVLTALAARTSTATADTGLRERVEALLAKWSGCWCGEQQYPDHDPRVQDCPRHGDGAADHFCGEIERDLAAILDATAAPTTDTGARDE